MTLSGEPGDRGEEEEEEDRVWDSVGSVSRKDGLGDDGSWVRGGVRGGVREAKRESS